MLELWGLEARDLCSVQSIEFLSTPWRYLCKLVVREDGLYVVGKVKRDRFSFFFLIIGCSCKFHTQSTSSSGLLLFLFYRENVGPANSEPLPRPPPHLSESIERSASITVVNVKPGLHRMQSCPVCGSAGQLGSQIHTISYSIT